jgi:hypothetical protein
MNQFLRPILLLVVLRLDIRDNKFSKNKVKTKILNGSIYNKQK